MKTRSFSAHAGVGTAPKLTTLLFVVFITLFVGVLELLMLFSPDPVLAVRVLLEENGPVETLQLVGYILISILAFQTAKFDPRLGLARSWRTAGWLALAGAGEECDWGNATRLFDEVRWGSRWNLLNIHNTIEAGIDALPGALHLAGEVVFLGLVGAILYFLLLRPLMESGRLWQCLQRTSGRFAVGGVLLMFCSQFFDMGPMALTNRSLNPYVDFWDEGLEVAAIACFLAAVVEERQWIRLQEQGGDS